MSSAEAPTRRALARRVLLKLPVLLVAGCGFRPLYAPRGAADPSLAAIQVAPIPERIGQRLTLALRDAFSGGGASVDPRYTLHVSLATTRREVGLRRDASASRVEIDVAARYTLVDHAAREEVMSGVARSFGGVDRVENEYANIVGEEDAHLTALDELAAEIQARCAAYLRHQAATRLP
jgi:LPS-assembly lipoprotein